MNGPRAGWVTAARWQLYGDDDIFWFVENVLAMLTRFDPAAPALISDDLGGCCHGGGQYVP